MRKRKRALITGLAGQDGSYLAEFLLRKGYEVWGTVRTSARPDLSNLGVAGNDPRLHILKADMVDSESLFKAVMAAKPDEVYNLAAISHAPTSWLCPSLTLDVNGAGVGRILEATRLIVPKARFYQASTSELFGAVRETPQNEDTPFSPNHPYAAAKLAGHMIARQYREQYGMFVCCGILFNHESPRRSDAFVTRKITKAVARAAAGHNEKFNLWTLDTVRDWGFAGDYVRAMWMMLQMSPPRDYVIGTGEGRTVGELCQIAFGIMGLDWKRYVVVRPPDWFKPDTKSKYTADPRLARLRLGWRPKWSFHKLIYSMIERDREILRQQEGGLCAEM